MRTTYWVARPRLRRGVSVAGVPACTESAASSFGRRDDPQTGRVDPSGDPNLFSCHCASRIDMTLEDGTHYRCEDLRAGCP
ncbi:hypothetical protein F5X71_11135 [Nocardia brasiliensis]|uniref:Uncharacterized protein n=1 Tax=Nocardia brasiliensis TaxID=37326 RepID=A0A6G9XPF9_NOCBR|nr:hypothetical protein [Nocardia brasiliensis]QIS02805.1 hypothetical protein F5X71_11135 [Nocardia brasiliensis]